MDTLGYAPWELDYNLLIKNSKISKQQSEDNILEVANPIATTTIAWITHSYHPVQVLRKSYSLVLTGRIRACP